MKGPIGYELSPLAEEGSQLVVDSFHPGDIRAKRLLEILEVMDVEILSRGIARANSKSIELTSPRPTAEQVLRFFNNRGGFDHWWDSISEDIQKEILEALAELLAPKDPAKEGQENPPAPLGSVEDPSDGSQQKPDPEKSA